MDCHHGAELFHTECYNEQSSLWSANNLSEDSLTTQQEPGFIQCCQNVDMSPVFSPGLSPLSLDSCDFSIQMLTDISACTQTRKNMADVSESPWTEILDLFSVGNKDLAGCMDVEAYFESICACQGDVGREVGADDDGFVHRSDSVTERICSNTSEVEDLRLEPDEYEYGYSFHGDQGLTINHFQSVLRQNENAAEAHFNSFKASQGANIIQNQLPTLIRYHCDASGLQTYQQPQEESPCMLADNQLFTPFEGVAQSFSVPPHDAEHRPIPTPPHEDDWLFTDILKDRKSPDC